MSIPAESSVLQNEVQIINARHASSSLDLICDNVLRLNIADLSDNCRHSAAEVGGLALSVAKSHGMEHAPHTRAVHAAMCLEREVAGRENW